jgi:Skp family chaperone for outer membrane proteins
MKFFLLPPVLFAILLGIVSCKNDKPATTEEKSPETPAEVTPAVEASSPATVVAQDPERTTTGGYATVNLQRLVRESKAGIAGSQRVDSFKALMEEALEKRKAYPTKIIAELEIINQQLKTAQPGSIEQKKWGMMLEATKSELTALAKDRDEFAKRRNQQLKEFSLKEIKSVIALSSVELGKLAKERGYLWVMDKSGISSSEVPIILYTKEKHPDVTEEMLRRMDAAFSAEKTED